MRTVLVVEDELVLRNELSKILLEHGYGVLAAADSATAETQLKNNAVQLVISELRSPAIDGLALLRHSRENGAKVSFVLLREHENVKDSVEALRMGADDSLVKPLAMDELPAKIQRILGRDKLAMENTILRRELDRQMDSFAVVGTGMAFDRMLAWIRKASDSRSPVLISGEPGSGKTTIARAIHVASSAKNEPFVTVHCAASSERSLESELFGHRRGAFEGAESDSEGLFRSAQKGTLFLNEVGALSPELQDKLIRALEERQIQPIGAQSTVPFSARIVASTSSRLPDELHARIAALEFHALPLRERRDDVPLLAAHFIRRFNRELNRKFTGIEEKAMRYFADAPWKGNVRELANRIERATILGSEPLLRAQDLFSGGQAPSILAGEMKDLKNAVSIFERDHIRRVIAERQGDKRAAARDLGISLSSLYRHLDLKGPM